VAVSSINRMAMVCGGLISGLFALSIPLHCYQQAAGVTLVSACAGSGLGFALAMITRTPKPLFIYAWLAAAALTFLPLFRAWPPGDSFDVTPWRGAPDILFNYFDFLRGGVFLLAMPYPFAALGMHGPDPLPTENQDRSAPKTQIPPETAAESGRHIE